LIGTISFRDVTAYGTGTRGVAWIDRDNWNARQHCLVFDFCPEVVKCPVRVSCPLPVPNRYPIADTLEVLKSDPAPGVLRGLHNTLADAVVGVGLVALLLAADLAELMLRRARALALQVAAAMRILAALVLDLLTAVCLTVAVCREVDNAKIDAEKPVNVSWFRRLDLAGDEQVELAVDVAQVGFAPVGFQQFALALTALVWHALATLKRPDAHCLLAGLEAQDAIIIRKSTTRLESMLYLLVKFVGIGCLRYRPHGHLCRQRVAFADVVVDDLVEAELAKNLAIPRLLADVVAGGVSRLKCVEQRVVLVGRRLQFDLRSQFHIVSITYPTERCKQKLACLSSPP